MPKGGKRVGAGRKKRAPVVALLPKPSVQVDSGLATPPAGLAKDVAKRWRELAPLAIARGTLTAESCPGFQLLCEVDVDWRALREAVLGDGFTVDELGQKKRHPLLGSLAEYTRRREVLFARFGLIADGKTAARQAAAAATNPWSQLA